MSEVARLFDRIATRYDLANRVLSLGGDLRWRRQALHLLPPGDGLLVDLACGTHDLGLAALRAGVCGRVVGVDCSPGMLASGATKIAGAPVQAVLGDAQAIPLRDGCADAVTIAFGWRNLGDPLAGLAAMHRLLRPGGHLLILDFFRPERGFPRWFDRVVAGWALPLAGHVLAGDGPAYRYLHESMGRFLSPAEAEAALAAQGFTGLRRRAFAGGVALALAASRPADGR